MSFDTDSNLPLIDPHKKTTQVNLWMGAGVAVFVAVAIAIIAWAWHRYGAEEKPVAPDVPASR
jgi:hypothetical protein